ncbi:MAG: hypothetical protein RI920_523, partial [Pseudomonadota bacterium]
MGRPTSPLQPRHRLLILTAITVVVAFGLMNTSYPWTLIHRQVAWSNVMLSVLVSPDFVSGSPHTP